MTLPENFFDHLDKSLLTASSAGKISSTFNGARNILPEKYFQSLNVGDILDNNEVNPLVYSRK